MTRRRKRHGTDDIVGRLRDAGAMLDAGKDLAEVLEALEVGREDRAQGVLRCAQENSAVKDSPSVDK